MESETKDLSQLTYTLDTAMVCAHCRLRVITVYLSKLDTKFYCDACFESKDESKYKDDFNCLKAGYDYY